jgi:hypothetical protein
LFKRANYRVTALLSVLALTLATIATAFAGPASAATTYTKGDLFLSTGNGHVQERTPSGTVVQTLDSGSGGAFNTGSAFDASGNLYVTEFSTATISKFGPTGTFLGTFGSGFVQPESIVFDKAGNVYVGDAGQGVIQKFSASGTHLASYNVVVEDRGTDWIDLAADQCTMRYTSEGSSVKQFNVCTNTQLPDFATGLPGLAAYAHRILPDGGELVADSNAVVRLSSAGAIVKTYTPSTSASTIFALNRDPDGTTFWTADLDSGNVFHFDIATGNQLGTFSASGFVGGLSLFGEITQGGGGGGSHTPSIFELDVKRCHTVYIGYNYFPVGTVIHWHVNQTGTGTLQSGSITTVGPTGKTYHFLNLTTTLTLHAGLHTHVYFTWVIKGVLTKFVSTRGPACS